MRLVQIKGQKLLNLDAVVLVIPRINDGEPLLTLTFASDETGMQFAGDEAVEIAKAISEASGYDIAF